MKYIRYCLIPLFMALLYSGCEDFDTLTVDPNRPTDVHPSLLLTSIEVTVFNEVSVGAAYASRYLVFTDGYSTDQTYGWQRSGYGGYSTLLQIYKMSQEAEQRNLLNYQALAKFFRAFQFMQLTMTFGDIPYSDALQGDEDVFKPTYDIQEEVFKGILQELREANDLLNESNGEITGDIIYDGDVMKWKKLVNSYKLRILMALSEKTGNSDLQVAEQFREIFENPETFPVFTSPEDQAQLVFYDRDQNRYPLFNDRSIQTANYLERTFVNLLKTRKDPRLFAIASPDRKSREVGQPGYQTSFSSFTGLDAGAYVNDNVLLLTEKGEGSPLNPRYYSDPVNEPSVAVGYPELMFNIAEAALRGWITADTSVYYENGVKASLQFYGVSAAKTTAYLSENLVRLNPATAFEQINIQKYLAYFLNSGWESFYNQRRTGIPEFATGPSTQNGGQIPKRWMYPQDELDYNFDNVATAINRQFNGNDNVNGVMWLLIPE